MTTIVVNCRKTSFENALGVPHFLLQLCQQLRNEHRIVLAVNNTSEFNAQSYTQNPQNIADEIVDVATARALFGGHQSDALELLPHHFQASEICKKSIMICHDMHVFDIPWKYPNAHNRQQQFGKDLSNATVVMTHFPRTYYGVEHFIGRTLKNLYLTPSPLMIDTSFRTAKFAKSKRKKRLLYPAQLQKHKNHVGLLEAASDVAALGIDFKIVCTGSSFDSGFSNEVHNLVSKLKIGEHIEFLGHLSTDDLIQQYRISDALIVPSKAEGGAYVAFEGLAAGKPIAINAIESAVMHLNSISAQVMWFDGERRDSIAKSIKDLCEADAALWFEKNKEAREKIASATWERVGALWNQVVHSLMRSESMPVPHIGVDGAVIGYS